MKVFLDANVLVAAVCGGHGDHARAFPILDRIQQGKDVGFISAHSLAEMYAILTRLPVPFRHTPEQAFLSLEENILKFFQVGGLTGTDYAALLRASALQAVTGGMIYDAVLLKSADKSGAERIYTFNVKHFEMIAPRHLLPLIQKP